MNNIAVIGYPFCEKESVSRELSKKFDLHYISIEEVIQQEKEYYEEYVSGERSIQEEKEAFEDIVPEQAIIQNIRSQIIESANKNINGRIFKGIPRNIDQAKKLDHFLTQRKEPIQKVFYLSAQKYTITKRAIDVGYIEDNRSGKQEIQSKINERQKVLKPIFDYFSKKDKLIEIDADKEQKDILEDFSFEFLELRI